MKYNSLKFLTALCICICTDYGSVSTREHCCIALQGHKYRLKQIFSEKELSGFSPNFYIHVYVSDLYITMIGLPILLQENMWTDPGNI
jgi:hypothetical protein